MQHDLGEGWSAFHSSAPSPSTIAWWWLGDHPHSFTSAELAQLWPHIVGLAIGYGALVGLAGLWLGGRNYRRLLQPN